MTRRRWVLTAALIAASCSGDKSEPAQPGKTAPPSASASSATPAGGAKTAPAPAEAERPRPAPRKLTRAERKQLNGYLRQGRALQKKEKWAESVAALEQAVALDPTNDRALSELSWSAFKAGAYDRAVSAAEDSVAFALDPRVKAASLFNLGRVHEQLERRDQAITAYQRSLRLRPNAVVEKRLVGLGGEVPSSTSNPPCAGYRPLNELCACLRKEFSDLEIIDVPNWPGRYSGRCDLVGEEREGIQQLIVTADDNERVRAVVEHFLVRSRGDERAVIDYLGPGFESHKFNAELELTGVEISTLGEHRVLRVEMTSTAQTDPDYAAAGMGFIEKTVDQSVLFCVDVEGFFKCPVEVLRKREYDVTLVEETEDDPAEILANFEVEFKQKPPIHRGFELEIAVAADGTVEVTHKSGDKDAEADRELGKHRLW